MRLIGGLALLGLLISGSGCGGRAAPPPKILVIGLDGATWDLLDPWMEAGELPHLRELRDGGVSGTLLSVLPPLSPPAWTTATTGVNPGAHGIFDFFRLDPDSMVAYTETAASRRVPGIWTLLSDAGRRVGILNIPMTDPPDRVNGFQVAGLPHPDTVGYAYPPDLETRLHARGYHLDRMGEALIEGQEEDLRTEILDTFRRRRDLALELGREHPDLDLYWVVFTGTDRIQHFFWKFMETDHPFYDPGLAARFGDSILEVYRGVDAAVGDLVDQAREQARASGRELAVIVLSDHGFCGIHRAFRPQSYLRHPPDGSPPITESYSLETNGTLLYVQERGRERGAVLDAAGHRRVVGEILDRILAARDPEDGLCPVVFGARREEVYRGRYVDKAPDVIFLAREHTYLIHEEGDKEPFGTPAFSFSAHHDIRGMIIANGPMFRSGTIEGRQSLLDISPTLMYLAGETVPGYMEGDVLRGLFQDTFLERWPVRRDSSEATETGSEDLDPVRLIPYLQ